MTTSCCAGHAWYENGQSAFAGPAYDLYMRLDAMFVRLARRLAAVEHHFRWYYQVCIHTMVQGRREPAAAYQKQGSQATESRSGRRGVPAEAAPSSTALSAWARPASPTATAATGITLR